MFNRVLREIHRRSQSRHKVQAWYYSRLFGVCGNGTVLHGDCHIKHPARFFIGKNAGINDSAVIVSTGLDPVSIKAEKTHVNKPVVIGNFVQIGAIVTKDVAGKPAFVESIRNVIAGRV